MQSRLEELEKQLVEAQKVADGQYKQYEYFCERGIPFDGEYQKIVADKLAKVEDLKNAIEALKQKPTAQFNKEVGATSPSSKGMSLFADQKSTQTDELQKKASELTARIEKDSRELAEIQKQLGGSSPRSKLL